MLTCLIPVLFTFYTHGVLKLKKNHSGAKGLNDIRWNHKTLPHVSSSNKRCVYLFVCYWRDSHQLARASSLSRFLDHIRRITVGRTPLDEWSARRRDLWQHTTLTTHRHPCPGGIRTHNLSRRAAADLHLRPRGPLGPVIKDVINSNLNDHQKQTFLRSCHLLQRARTTRSPHNAAVSSSLERWHDRMPNSKLFEMRGNTESVSNRVPDSSNTLLRNSSLATSWEVTITQHVPTDCKTEDLDYPIQVSPSKLWKLTTEKWEVYEQSLSAASVIMKLQVNPYRTNVENRVSS